MAAKAEGLQENSTLHKLCHDGNLRRLKEFVEKLSDKELADKLASKRDVYRRTPKQTASKASIVRLLANEEIIREVENDGDKLSELLKNTDQLDPICLDKALMIATRNNNHCNIGKLVMKGAMSLDACIEFAQKENKPHARAMLLMIKASHSGNKSIVQKLVGEMLNKPDEVNDPGFPDVQKAFLSGKVSTVVPIEIARRNGHLKVQEELLLKTNVDQYEGYIYWHELGLLQLEVPWLRRISWVKRLWLAKNRFKTLPSHMGMYLKQVEKIDLRHNDLTSIPHCLLELPSLEELLLSHNKLTNIPDVREWSDCLTILDLSHNQLSSMPSNVVAPNIRSLNLSHNSFRTVPLCICSFVSLHSLNLSDNPDILTLPAEMGRLSMLSCLYLKNLKNLKDPPRNLQKDPRDCIRYLNSKLHNTKEFFRMKLIVGGLSNCGKTTLVKRLQDEECGNEATVGVDVSEWWYKPSLGKKKFHFSIWDFGGYQEYYATHKCLHSQHSLYLLLFNLLDGQAGVKELKPWLNNIALRAPRSLVIIIGTHLDEVPEERREEIDLLLNRVGTLLETYHKLQIVEVMPVGLKNRIENISLLREAIYTHAANYKTKAGQHIMGQKIPASYHALDKQLEVVQQEVRQGLREPIMHSEEFKTMIQQMNLADIQDEEELKTATLFLGDVGSLLHFDDHSHNLHELYFVDPPWLCDMMSKIVTLNEKNPKGIQDIRMLFKDNVFPLQYFEQYLTLLDRFEIALPLDNRRVLIPSMLPEERPKHLAAEDANIVYSRYIMFNAADTPPGFWSRLLSRIMHSIFQVCCALDIIAQSSLILNSPEQETERLDNSFSMKAPASLSLFSKTAIPANFIANSDDNHFSPSISESEAFNLPLDINRPMRRYPQVEHNCYSAPLLLPNFSNLPTVQEELYNAGEIQLDYWRTGLYYKDPGLMFRIESLAKSNQNIEEGVLIVASPNNQGKRMIAQLVNLVISLIQEWYPGLAKGDYPVSNILKEAVPCFECLKAGHKNPFVFKFGHCLHEISRNHHTTLKCGYHKDDPSKNHTVALSDIVPDLLLQDIDPSFLLNADDISYQENDRCLLGKGGYAKVYKGKCHNQSVAIKKYITYNESAITELHHEARLLQQCCHPCIVSLVGACVHPVMALVMEEAPLKSLEFPIMKKKIPVHRLTLFRIAAEVAAALHFLHTQGIIFRDIKAANVLLWTLNPASLCHCKLTDFNISTQMFSAVGVRQLLGTKGFIAPEVIYSGKKHSMYDHKADIFSFGMLLYQIISRRHPYHDIPPHRIDVSVEAGDRPKLHDVDVATTGYHYLTMLMKKCWEDNPKNRPSAEEIIKTVCLAPMQSVMCVFPVQSRFSLCQAISLTPANIAEVEAPYKLHNELWVCCDGVEGAELSIYNCDNMVETSKHFMKDNHVQCMALCNDHVWVGSRAGTKSFSINCFNIVSHELIHNCVLEGHNLEGIKISHSVSCITAAKDRIFIGTLEGYCFIFSSDVAKVCSNAKPQYKYISEHAVDGIACTSEFIWVSHTRYICFLNPENLALEGSVSHDKERDAFIGQLSASLAEDIIWSAHLGGIVLTAWDAQERIHSFDINACKVLQKIMDTSIHDSVITAMVPALDTVWVGMATGHIMIFHKEDLLTWYQPYKKYVRFLNVIPGSGPCEMEKSMVVSGGKDFIPLVKDMGPDYEKEDENGQPVDKAGVLVIWEAFEAKTMRQVKLVEENSPGYLDSHHTVRMMIKKGDFKDGTHINKLVQNSEASYCDAPQDPYPPDLEAQPNPDYLSTSIPRSHEISDGSSNTRHSYTGNFTEIKTANSPIAKTSELPSTKEAEEEGWITGNQERTVTVTSTKMYSKEEEMFEINLPGPHQ